ncbi:MAG: putative O-linked N-acetylglucosamine transferase, SPINDLY family [Candidatus Accumulibacter adjunctus]|uniref:O-linked N-acetylglucosamine transferase, SPINDLY family n=1 Tax=Candidatus Accumulibacter adjunctus TaxID=1454001 RepID=A0A011PQR7_9PROT|nr:MAG: putative O-linked N-acetylglucosamine transferase, SPINDLY family [Candidatus Accumulibacter adjunctus]
MIDLLFDLFASFYERGDLASAEHIALKIRQAVPDDAVAWHLLGLVRYRIGRRDDALRAFDAADGAKHRLRLTQPDDRGLSASLECLRVACRDGSRLGRAWYDLALLQLRLRRYPQAIFALQAAAAAQPERLAAACRALERVAKRCRSDFGAACCSVVSPSVAPLIAAVPPSG